MISRRAKTPIQQQKKKLLLWCISIAAVVLVIFGGSFFNLVHNKLELKKLNKQTVQLEKDFQALSVELELLQKQDPVYLEKLARTRYHMTKPGETEFRFQPEK